MPCVCRERYGQVFRSIPGRTRARAGRAVGGRCARGPADGMRSVAAGQVFLLQLVIMVLFAAAAGVALVVQARNSTMQEARQLSMGVAEAFAHAPGTLDAMKSHEPHRAAAAARGGRPEEDRGRLHRRVRSPGLPLDPSRPEADREARSSPSARARRRPALHPDLRGQPGPRRGHDGPRLRHRREDVVGFVSVGVTVATVNDVVRGAAAEAARHRRRRAGAGRGRDGAGDPAAAAADPRPGAGRDDADVRAPRRGAARGAGGRTDHRRRRAAAAGQRRGAAAAGSARGRRAAPGHRAGAGRAAPPSCWPRAGRPPTRCTWPGTGCWRSTCGPSTPTAARQAAW